MRFLLFAFFVYFSLPGASAQRFWHYVSEHDLNITDGANRPIQPAKLQALELDFPFLQSVLANAPMEFTPGSIPVQLELPTADGGVRLVSVWESPVMAPELAAKYPNIRTYSGTSSDGCMVRLGIGPLGFHAFTFAPDGAIQTVRPYAQGAQRAYMAYHLKDLPNTDLYPGGHFICGTDEQDVPVTPAHPSHIVLDRSGNVPVTLKKYRAAISAQAEYSAFHGNTKTTVMNAVVEAMNFIGAIQERDMSVRLELIPNNDTLFYYDTDTDPYTGAGVGQWMPQNIAPTNLRVGINNYDIGHVLCRIINPPGGVYVAGLAQLSCVCSSNKAGGGSSLPAPIGEQYYLITAHEMGHQFSATHTFNSCPPAADSRTGSTAFEPGGGSTIMSYAGTCDPDIVEYNQQPYFLTSSVEQMAQFTTQDGGSTCPVMIPTGNTSPEVSIPLTNGFYIPISTPFALTGIATDVDGDNLTYCWEQYDLGPVTPLGQPIGSAPAFRSFPPTNSPTRTFPRIQTIISNTPSKTEVLPTYNRELNFRLTVRDNHAGGGGFAWEQIKFRATTQAGPFTVTSPNSAGSSWLSGDYQVVTWDVANTDKAPVNCKSVNIRLSTDGGLTYPTVLASGVPNIGRYCVQVPDTTAAKARVRVEAADNIFFDISNADFKIEAPTQPGFSLCSTRLVDTICLPTVYSVSISTSKLQDLAEPITLSFASELTDAVATFSPAQAVPGSDVVLTLEFPNGHPEGTFKATVIGSAAGLIDSSVISLYIVNNDFSPLALLSPTDGALGQDESPVLHWNLAGDANVYDVEIASNPSFASNVLVASQANIAADSFKIPVLLGKGQVFYWRVRPRNECQTGDWVGPFVFATLVNVCTTFESTDVPKNISGSQLVTVESKINVPAGGVISDVNVTKFEGNHEFFKDLEVHVISPANTDVLLFTEKCPNYNGSFNMGFDDSKTTIFGCPPPKDGSTSKPTAALSAFNGQNAGGVWILRVKDNALGGGGKITGFALELCSNASLNPPVLINNNVMSINPGANKAITPDLLKTEDANNTDQQLVYTLVTIPQHGELQLNWTGKMGPGAQFTQADLNNGALRYFDYGTNSTSDDFCFTVTDGEGGLIKDCFTIQPVVGTKEITRALDFLLAPNPATETLRIGFSTALSSDARIRMFDASGRLVQERVLASGQVSVLLNVSNLPEGLYTVTVDSPAGNGVRKVVVR